MSATPAETRPRQVTMAGVLVVVGSVLVVLSSFERMASLRSLDTRESIEEALSEPPASGLGLGVEGVLDLLQVLVMVAAACATATAILGYQALQRSRSARLALGVLAVPLALTGLVAGGILAFLVAVAVLMLFLQPAKDWYDGRSRPAATAARERDADAPADQQAAGVWGRPDGPSAPYGRSPQPDASQPTPSYPDPSHPGPRPYAGFGATPVGADHPAGHPAGPAAAPTARPGAVAWACAITWAVSVLVAVGMVLSASALALDPDTLMEQFRSQEPELAAQVSRDVLVTITVVMAAIVTAWCLAAVVLAALTFRGVPWARIALLVCAAAAAGVCLLGSLAGSFPLLVPLAACSLTIALLSRPESRRWFAGRGSMRG